VTTPVNDEEIEIQQLRERISALESELADTQSWAYRTVAAAQERTYWLDRWQVDLNAVMRRPGVRRAQTMARGARGVVRAARRAKRRLRNEGL
jgi:hypothetical protein